MSKMSRDKGARIEREIVSQVLAEAFSTPLVGDRSGIRGVARDGAPVEAEDGL
jgi:hypothetical protein